MVFELLHGAAPQKPSSKAADKAATPTKMPAIPGLDSKLFKQVLALRPSGRAARARVCCRCRRAERVACAGHGGTEVARGGDVGSQDRGPQDRQRRHLMMLLNAYFLQMMSHDTVPLPLPRAADTDQMYCLGCRLVR